MPRRVWLAGVLFAMASCAAPSPPTVRNSFELAPYRPFLTPASLLPFRATGSVRLNYKGEAQSGDFVLLAGKQQHYQFQLLAPLTGALVLEVRFDSARLLLLDYTQNTYFAGANTPENRGRLLGLDMTPREFLMAITGRLPRREFASAGGKRLSGRRLHMSRGATSYDFWLDAQGLPDRWEKARDGRLVFRVEYRDYLELATENATEQDTGQGAAQGTQEREEQGALLRLPRKIRIYTDGEKPALILGVREIIPGVARSRPPGFDPPQGGDWRPQVLPPSAR